MSNFITIDIETIPTAVDPDWIAAREEKIKEEYVKEDTIKKYMGKAIKDWRWEPHGSRPICIGMHSSVAKEYWCESSDDSIALAGQAVDKINEWSNMLRARPLKFVGFNILSFDLIRLHAYARKAGKELEAKIGRWDTIDLITFPYGFALGKKSLSTYLKLFGIDAKLGNGSQVEDLHGQDLFDGGTRVKDYCLGDVKATVALLEAISSFWQV